VCFSHFIGPGFNLFGFDLNRLAALSADKVMVVIGSAGAVKQFTVLTLKAVGLPLCSQIRERPIDSSQTDG
jgi:hypothetical protein